MRTPEDLNQLPANGVCKWASSISYYDMPQSCQSRQITGGNHMAHPEHLSHPIPPNHLIRVFFFLFLSVASNCNCITHSFWATIPWHHFKLQLYITVWHKHNLTVTEKPKLSGSHETSASDRIWHGLSEGEEPLRQILKAVIMPWYRALFIESNTQQGYNLMKMSVSCCGRHHIENDKYKFRGAIPWRLGVPHDISCQMSTPH